MALGPVLAPAKGSRRPRFSLKGDRGILPTKPKAQTEGMIHGGWLGRSDKLQVKGGVAQSDGGRQQLIPQSQKAKGYPQGS